MKWRLFWLFCLLFIWLFCSGAANAGPLAERLSQFPNWVDKPPVQAAEGDLAYPNWFKGTWEVTTTLVDLVAPLSPEVTTPGFESNRQYVNQPVTFRARFLEKQVRAKLNLPIVQLSVRTQPQVVADRAFNGLNLSKAYLGDRTILSVKVDPSSPNRQVTFLRGDRQLASTITGRATEAPEPETFLTTEVFQQLFRGTPQPYFNQVETTTAYRHCPSQDPAIVADQVTAIYLSPQDPDYFKAGERPVALYRYQLEFSPLVSAQ